MGFMARPCPLQSECRGTGGTGCSPRQRSCCGTVPWLGWHWLFPPVKPSQCQSHAPHCPGQPLCWRGVQVLCPLPLGGPGALSKHAPVRGELLPGTRTRKKGVGTETPLPTDSLAVKPVGSAGGIKQHLVVEFLMQVLLRKEAHSVSFNASLINTSCTLEHATPPAKPLPPYPQLGYRQPEWQREQGEAARRGAGRWLQQRGSGAELAPGAKVKCEARAAPLHISFGLKQCHVQVVSDSGS